MPESSLVSQAVLGETQRVADTLGVNITLDGNQVQQLARYFVLLAQWNQHIRLAGARDPQTLVSRHLADALVLHRVLPASLQHGLDVGSGGGLPSLPLLILSPQHHLDLVEANAKKCAFLRTAAHELGLDVHIAQARVEQWHPPYAYEAAWSLATFAPAEWLRRARSLIQPSGGMVGVFSTSRQFGAHSLPWPPPGYHVLGEQPYALADGSSRLLTLYQLNQQG